MLIWILSGIKSLRCIRKLRGGDNTDRFLLYALRRLDRLFFPLIFHFGCNHVKAVEDIEKQNFVEFFHQPDSCQWLRLQLIHEPLDLSHIIVQFDDNLFYLLIIFINLCDTFSSLWHILGHCNFFMKP